MVEFRARRAPLVVHLVGRWYQGLGAIVLMIGLGAVQFGAYRARAEIATVALVGIAFLALSAVLFLVGQSVIHGRRWAWRLGVVLAGTLLVFLLYAVTLAQQPLGQRVVATAITAVLFGVPLVGLGLPASRRFFAGPEP
ncbi:MAG: hypothetical protein HYR51_04910 [Candidatus Rokubacteria bacterium]|nr:hypothetical protein [Candidatus Rokubacteria bacterium]